MGPLMTFTEWLLQNHLKENNPIGDLAKDVSIDPDWPQIGGQYQIYKDYFARINASDAATKALEKAWKLYTKFISGW